MVSLKTTQLRLMPRPPNLINSRTVSNCTLVCYMNTTALIPCIFNDMCTGYHSPERRAAFCNRNNLEGFVAVVSGELKADHKFLKIFSAAKMIRSTLYGWGRDGWSSPVLDRRGPQHRAEFAILFQAHHLVRVKQQQKMLFIDFSR